MRYKVYWSVHQDTLEITDLEARYTLYIMLQATDHCRAIFSAKKGKNNLLITARDLHEYAPEIRTLEIRDDHRYAEVGAGLGGFIPALLSTGVKRKPVVIDPADYSVMGHILLYAKTLPVGKHMQSRLEELIERCEIMHDTHLVTLVNTRIQHALAMRPDLKRSCDVVVDNTGALQYSSRTPHGKKRILSIEKSLLRGQGMLLSELVTNYGIEILYQN